MSKKLNIVIFSGGGGSIQLQNGLNKFFSNNVLNIDIIISAYDNGKSTGDCRKIFDGNILGPSDLRKNQIHQYSLSKQYKQDIVDLFNYRFDAESPEDAKNKCYQILSQKVNETKLYNEFKNLIDYFFYSSNVKKDIFRPILTKINFNDFSLANILYSACANQYNNSLSNAGKVISDLLGIRNNVHLISDTNLYLTAETTNRVLISDEEQIVDWNRKDRISKIHLIDNYGNEVVPEINEESKQLISNADIIIFSSGTQFSSLIPTYYHRGFSEAISKSNAEKYLVMNNIQDKDMIGFSADDIITEVSKYFSLKDVTIVLNSNADKNLNHITDYHNIKNIIVDKLSDEYNSKFHNDLLARIIMNDYFNLKNKDIVILDFDGTLYDKNDYDTSIKNLSILKENALSDKQFIIISGNSEKHFKNIFKSKNIPQLTNIDMFIDGGNSLFNFKENKCGLFFIKYICNDFNISNDVYNRFCQQTIKYINTKGYSINYSMFENRNGVIISIKPIIDKRNEIAEELEIFLKKFNTDNNCNLKTYINGKTTIDIMEQDYNKSKIIRKILSENDLMKTIFIGDSIKDGNDNSIKNLNIDYIETPNIEYTNVILNSLL